VAERPAGGVTRAAIRRLERPLQKPVNLPPIVEQIIDAPLGGDTQVAAVDMQLVAPPVGVDRPALQNAVDAPASFVPEEGRRRVCMRSPSDGDEGGQSLSPGPSSAQQRERGAAYDEHMFVSRLTL
jgi:hypothetical protein